MSVKPESCWPRSDRSYRVKGLCHSNLEPTMRGDSRLGALSLATADFLARTNRSAASMESDQA